MQSVSDGANRLMRQPMLTWSLWLAFALLRWLTWGWQSFSTAGLWRQRLRKGSFRFLSAEGREIKEDDTTSK